jgi:hypothetical protein
MCPESAVIATQEAMGAMEEVFGLVYPDPRYRLKFRVGLLQHGVWEAPMQKSPDSVYKDELEDVLFRRRRDLGGYRVMDQTESLRRRLVKMIPVAVVGPLCALYEFSIQNVFTSTDSKQIGLN